MAEHQARAYLDPGTPEEQSRRQFLANATVAIGGVIGLVLTVPLVVSLIPESLIKPDKAGGVWSTISDADFKALQGATQTPVKITFTFKYADGYMPAADDTQFVYGIRLSDAQVQNFKNLRPDLFGNPAEEIHYPAVNLGFVIFSSVCPHLGCRYAWNPDAKRFICPCHGSQFSEVGAHLAGPAPRGLDPLPLREQNGKAEITWIQYKSGEPDRVIVAYS